MDQLEKFRYSSDKLIEFLGNWAKPFEEKCEKSKDNQLRASYYIWARYSMSIKTLRNICRIEFFPDLCVIGRCCLEFSASLQAVLSDKKAADDYIQFEKHSKSNYYKKYLKSSGKHEKIAKAKEHLRELGVENPDNYKWDKWCARLDGFSKLIENHKGPKERELYSFFSDFAHGSIIAVQILQNLQPSIELLEKPIKLVYSDYILSTKTFLDKVWGPIITNESEKCKREFNQVAQLFC